MATEKPTGESCEDKEPRPIRFEPSALGQSVAIKRQKKIEHGPQWLPHPCLSIILGRSSCGKSYLLGAILPQLREVCHVVILTPIITNPVYQALGDFFTQKNIRFEICGSIKDAQTVLGNAIAKQDKGKYGICVMDDMNAGQRGSASSSANNVLSAIYTKIRNYNWHCFIICQDITMLPTRARTNANMWVIFQQVNSFSIRQIMRDLPNLVPDVTPEELGDLFDTLKQDRHAFMLASVCADDVPRVFVANKDTQMKLSPVEFARFDPHNDNRLAEISQMLQERPTAAGRRLARNYLDFIENQHGRDARAQCLKAYPVLRMA
jgi:hypothetical protein